MRASPVRSAVTLFVIGLWLAASSFGSAYNGHPKLVVVIVIDQFRGDYLERYRDQFGEGGFRLFLDRGAYFTDCNYDYANTRTAPGHATLFTGSYSSGHGILANEWWDPAKRRMVTSVQDDDNKIVGVPSTGPGASPHNLLSTTLGDELKLATQGKARVFGISLKDRAAIIPAGFAADGAYWSDAKSGAWITSTYYRSDLPEWVQNANARIGKYLGNESGRTPGATPREMAGTPQANAWELDFAQELILYEHLGTGPATDLLAISLSPNDILGHRVGPDSPDIQAMTLALDKQLADFFNFLGHQIGLANVWIALSADHGISPLPSTAAKLRIPAANLDRQNLQTEINALLNTRFSPGRKMEYVKAFDYPLAWLDDQAFGATKVKEEEAERAVGEALKQVGLRGYFTRIQLAQGTVPDTDMGRRYLHSYSPVGGWYVMGIPAPFTVGITSGTDHPSPYTYDTHVPLAFYGLAFQPGTYRGHAEPVDLAVTLASLLGINAPTHATGRVLTEALAVPREGPRPPATHAPMPPKPPGEEFRPAAFMSKAEVGR
jgi:arylsulfatase A-like enzyme